jgi:hypothetical protein
VGAAKDKYGILRAGGLVPLFESSAPLVLEEADSTPEDSENPETKIFF